MIAPRIAYIEEGDGTTSVQVASDEPIIVYGIIVDGSAAVGIVSFLDKDETELFRVTVPDGIYTRIKTPFHASNGLRVTTDANTTATVFHSHPGM